MLPPSLVEAADEFLDEFILLLADPTSLVERGLVKKFSIFKFKFLNSKLAAAKLRLSSFLLSSNSLALFSK